MILGLDLASVDGNKTRDYQKAFSAGARFLYLRRSYCYYDTGHRAYVMRHDDTYAQDAQRARDAGFVVGAFLFPIFDAGAPSMQEQWANFQSAGGKVIPGVDLPIAIDVEFTGKGIQETKRSKADVFKLILELVTLARASYPTCAIYTSHVQWHDDNGLGGPDDPILDDVILWQKTPYRLKARQPLDWVPAQKPHVGGSDYWTIPRPWVDQGYRIQQVQGDCLGFAGFDATVDIDVWNPITETVHTQADVFWLEHKLGLLSTGTWSKKLTEALQKFQKDHELVPDCVIGPRTWVVLLQQKAA